jgi:isochorismate hydrolase
MINAKGTVMVIIDVQDKLSRVMYEKELLLDNLQRLIKGIQVLEIPIMVTEQNPRGLGATVPEVSNLLPHMQPIAKFSFSCCGEERFLKELKELHCKQILVAGIETHVCVYQTVIDLLGLDYEVQVVADCVSSRSLSNRELGLNRMSLTGAHRTSTEMVLFELLKVAEGERFRMVSKIVR